MWAAINALLRMLIVVAIAVACVITLHHSLLELALLLPLDGR